MFSLSSAVKFRKSLLPVKTKTESLQSPKFFTIGFFKIFGFGFAKVARLSILSCIFSISSV